MLKMAIKAFYKRQGFTAKSLSLYLGRKETYLSKGISQCDYVSRPMCALLLDFVTEREPDNRAFQAQLHAGAYRPRPTTVTLTPYEDDWTNWLKVRLLDKLNTVEYHAVSPYVRGVKRTTDTVYVTIFEYVWKYIPDSAPDYINATVKRTSRHTTERMHMVNTILHVTMCMDIDDLTVMHAGISDAKG